MTREEAIKDIRTVFVKDFADKIIKALEPEPCEMTAEEYRQRMIQAFHNGDTDELIAICVLPNEKEFEHLEWLLKNHYKQEPCNDAISRQAAIDAVEKNTFRLTFAEEHNCEGYVAWSAEAVYSDVIEGALLELPPVTPQPKIGHWITTRTFMHDGEYYCDKCKCAAPNNEKWDYCPNCGAKMQEVEE